MRHPARPIPSDFDTIKYVADGFSAGAGGVLVTKAILLALALLIVIGSFGSLVATGMSHPASATPQLDSAPGVAANAPETVRQSSNIRSPISTSSDISPATSTGSQWSDPGAKIASEFPQAGLLQAHPEGLSGVPSIAAAQAVSAPLRMPSGSSSSSLVSRSSVNSPALSWEPNVPVGFENTFARGQPQNEPSIAASPVDPNTVVAIYHDYDSNALVTIKVSHDGGRTWGARIPQPWSTGATFDPAITVDSAGVFYGSYLANGPNQTSQLVLSKSTDNGASWVQSVARAAVSPEFLDKDYIAVDRVTGTLYATYTNFVGFSGIQIEVIRSIDAGFSWSAPTVIAQVDYFDRPGGHVIQGSVPATRNGVAIVTYYDSGDDGWLTGNFVVRAAVSTDDGVSWGPATAVSTLPGEMPYYLPSGIPDPFFWPRIWGTMFPVPAVGPEGNLYVVSVAANGNLGDVFFMKSTNQGGIWSPPMLISDDSTGHAQFFPWIAIADDGTIHVTYADRRDDPDDAFYDVFYTSSVDLGATFAPGAPVTDTANTPSWYFIGDYFGLAVSSGGTHPVWTDNRVFENMNDVYTARGDLVVTAPSIRSIPNRARVGEPAGVVGTNFAPNDVVTVSFDGVPVASSTSDLSGAFVASIIIPERTAGRYPLSANDSLGNRAVRFFIVVPTLSAPASVTIGDSTPIAGSHFVPNGNVALFLGSNLLGFFPTDFNGNFSVVIQAHGPPGQQILWAVDVLGPFPIPLDDFAIRPIDVVPPPGWRLLAPLPEPREGAAGEISGGQVYVLHGETPSSGDTTDVRIYDPLGNSWSSGAPGLDPPSSEQYQAARVTRDGLERLYVIGGKSISRFGVLSENREFTPSTGTWAYRAPMPTARAGAAVAVVDNRIYVIGGRDCPYLFCFGARVFDTVEIYDPATDSWTTGASMPTARTDASAAVLGGLVVVVGGWMFDNRTAITILGTTEIYDPITDSWASAPGMPTARSDLGSATCNGWVVAAGGFGSFFGPSGFSDAVELFHPALGWRSGTFLPTPRGELIIVSDGTTLYAIGGRSAAGPTNATEAFDCSFFPPAPVLVSLVLTPPSGAVAGSVLVKGSGAVGAGITMTAYWDRVGPGATLGSGSTDANGKFSISVIIPEAVFGGHRIITEGMGGTPTPRLHYGSASFSVAPSLSAVKAVLAPGERLDLGGGGFPASADIELNFEDVRQTTVVSSGLGSFAATIFVPQILGGTYGVHAIARVEGVSADATIAVVEQSVLDVQASVGTLHFRGEVVDFFVLVTAKGAPTDATITATVWFPGGTSQSLVAAQVATGLYRATYTLPGTAPMGTYTFVAQATVSATYLTGSGAGLATFIVSPTLSGAITSISNGIAQIQTETGSIRVDLDAVSASIVSIQGDTATISTSIGTLTASLAALDAKVTSIDGDLATVQTTLGTITVKLDALDAKITVIQGDVATIKTNAGTTTQQLSSLQSTGGLLAMSSASVAAILSAVAAIFALASWRATRRPKSE